MMGTEVRLRRVTSAAADDRAADMISDVIAVAKSPPALDGHDPLVLALAQLVRDRWAIEQAQDETALALRARPSNMRTVDEGSEPGLERSA